MKKWILAGSASAFAVCLWAQEPQEIRGIIEEARDSAWYAGQVKAWDRVVMQDTLDEQAWRNLFEAAKGLSMVAPREGGKAMRAVLDRMGQAIPETFAYNISAYRAVQGPDNAFAEKALEQLPADIGDRGYDAVLGYLWMMGDADGEGERTDLFNDILRRQYEHGKYPSFILRYDYNQLQGMDEGGLFFGNGDMDLYGKIMLQRVLGTDTDKVLVVLPMLVVSSYRNALCRRLGIPLFPSPKVTTGEEYEAALCDMVERLVRETGRPGYFAPGIQRILGKIAHKLYNEGLVYKYSECPYDNIVAAKRHVEQDYHLEYLTEPEFRKESWWSGSEGLQLNYTVMLAHLVGVYRKKGEEKKAERLYHTLRASVENGHFSEERKNVYLDYLERWR